MTKTTSSQQTGNEEFLAQGGAPTDPPGGVMAAEAQVNVMEGYAPQYRTGRPHTTNARPIGSERSEGGSSAMPSSGTMKLGAVAAVVAAPIALKVVTGWRKNPKHIHVHQAMSRDAVVVLGTETVAEAARTLESCDIGAAPICSEGRLVGMITDRDIVTKVVALGRDPQTTFARELGGGTPVVVDAHDSIEHAARTMEHHGVRRLPVIEDDRVVGMISQADIAQRLGAERAGTLLEKISGMPDNN